MGFVTKKSIGPQLAATLLGLPTAAMHPFFFFLLHFFFFVKMQTYSMFTKNTAIAAVDLPVQCLFTNDVVFRFAAAGVNPANFLCVPTNVLVAPFLSFRSVSFFSIASSIWG